MIRYYPHYGRVMYTHGPGVDEPLSILRAGYGKDSVRFHPFHVLPHRDGLGRYDIGTFTLGTATYQQDGAWVEIEWPARNTQTFHRFKPETPEPVSWMGGLIDQQRTIGGNLYMRNRYYDPVSGRFTQEDPIGLAGGLNFYGYANGDPINLRDPFGLCPRMRVDDKNVTIEAKLDFVGGTPADHTRVRKGIERHWGKNMHGYSILLNLDAADAPVVEVFSAKGTGGVGGSMGRGQGGQMLVRTGGGSTTVQAVAGHEFGHVLALGHHEDKNNLMHWKYLGGHRITKEQLEEAIKKCREEEKPAENPESAPPAEDPR